MKFYHKQPSKKLEYIVKSYWSLENDESTPVQQKIIPDGFPELIFHYGDPYRTNISGSWKTQSKIILAGQIRNYFF